MGIDLGAILDSAVDAAADAVSKTAPEVEDFLREIVPGHEEAIRAIAEAFADGDIDDETFLSEMDDEAETLKAELQAAAVLTKAIAQRAINAFREALLDGIKSSIATIL